jgi:hypothetical protein
MGADRMIAIVILTKKGQASNVGASRSLCP